MYDIEGVQIVYGHQGLPEKMSSLLLIKSTVLFDVVTQISAFYVFHGEPHETSGLQDLYEHDYVLVAYPLVCLHLVTHLFGRPPGNLLHGHATAFFPSYHRGHVDLSVGASRERLIRDAVSRAIPALAATHAVNK
jgi:hypothetical protein